MKALRPCCGPMAMRRDGLIIEGLNGRTAYLEGDWVYIPRYLGPRRTTWGPNIETGFCFYCSQLYNLAEDPGQRDNRAWEEPGRMRAKHQDILDDDPIDQ